MRTNEYLYILQTRFGDKFKIESVPMDTEWGTWHCKIVVYVTDLVFAELKQRGRKIDFVEDGIAACMDLDSVGIGENIDEAVEWFFQYCHDKNLLHEDENNRDNPKKSGDYN